MNQSFCDPAKKVFIKVLDLPEKIEREVVGAATFSAFVTVPKIRLLDSRTLKTSMIRGAKSDLLEERALNKLIINLFCQIKNNFSGKIIEKFTIGNNVESLKAKMINRPKITAALKFVEREISNQPLYPVHGDLQKQNIFVDKGKLSLIDFEHFSFAPLELELVNSLFFNDQNCLNMGIIIPALWQKKIISLNLLTSMLVFYSIKELAIGKSPTATRANLKAGFTRLRVITSGLFDQTSHSNRLNQSKYWLNLSDMI